MSPKRITRRDMLKMLSAAAAGTILTACQPKVVEKAVEKTVEVEVEVEKTVEVEKLVEVTAVPPSFEPQNIVWMQSPGEAGFGYDSVEEAIQSFTDTYGHTVERIERNDAGVPAMVAAGQPLDVVRIIGLRMGLWATRGLALDLTDYFDAGTVLDVDDMLPVNDLFVLNDRRYGGVSDWSADYAVWINKKMWEEAGIEVPEPGEVVNLKDWREYSSKLSKFDGDVRLVTGTNLNGSSLCLELVPLTFENSRGMFEDDAAAINIAGDAEIVEALEWYVAWEKEGGVPSPITSLVTGDANQEFTAGAAAAIQRGYWYGSEIANATEIDPSDCMLLPAPGWGPNYASPCGYGCGNFITRHSQVPDAAWKLFEWYIGEEPAVKRAEAGCGLPAFESFISLLPADEPWREQARNAVMWDVENSISPMVPVSQFTDLWTISGAWNSRLQDLLTDATTLEESIAATEAEVNQQSQDILDSLGIVIE